MNVYDRINRDRDSIKKSVKEHWESEPCESRAGRSADRNAFFKEIDDYRYNKSPFIPGFAKFEEGKNKRVLEVGLGSGSDFVRWAQSQSQARLAACPRPSGLSR